MVEPKAGACMRIGSRSQLVHGHAFGLRGPMLIVLVQWHAQTPWNTPALVEILARQGGLKPEDASQCLAGGFTVDAFLALVLAFETAAHTPVTRPGVVVVPESQIDGWVQYTVAVPCSIIRATQAFIEGVVLAVNEAHAPAPGASAGVQAQAVLAQGRAVLDKQRQVLGLNMQRIARACSELDLPWHALPGGFLHCGSGRSARLFQSTKSEETSALAVSLARSKSGTNALLSLQGLPVPRHHLVVSEDDAVRAAKELGYPVVVKPDDCDGGDGVHAGLKTDEQVRRCYLDARAMSSRVLVEQHIEGLDHRITVDNGRVVKSIGRRPGGIDGDGQSTVEALVTKAAHDMPASRLKSSTVKLDDEALDLLAERGMTPHSVPRAGEFIALRRRANMSTGGIAYDALGAMHPDNVRLAIRAAKALRLDLAGIDLIIPDISVSWMDCTAGICEVNAQPQISTEFAPEVYRDLLRRMVPVPRRLRTILLLVDVDNVDADNGDVDLAVVKESRRLQQEGEQVFSVRATGSWLNEERIAPPGTQPRRAARCAEFERDATAAVAALTAEQVMENGLPWLHIDELKVLRAPGAVASARLQAALNLAKAHVVQPPIGKAVT